MRSIFGRINIDLSPINTNLFHKSINELTLLPDNKKETLIRKNTAFAQVTLQLFAYFLC